MIHAGVIYGFITPDFEVVPHSHVKATACPGRYTLPFIDDIHKRAREMLKPQPIKPEPEPEPVKPAVNIEAAASPFSNPTNEADYLAAIDHGFISAKTRDDNATREMLGLVAARVYDAATRASGDQTEALAALTEANEELRGRLDALTTRVDRLNTVEAATEQRSGSLILAVDLDAVRNAANAGIVTEDDLIAIRRKLD